MNATLSLRHTRPSHGSNRWRPTLFPRNRAADDMPVSLLPTDELKAATLPLLSRSTFASCVLWILVFSIGIGVTSAMKAPLEERTIVIVPYRSLTAPPPLTQKEAPPQIAVAPAATSPTVGIAVPVPDAEAPADQTIASQSEIASLTPGPPTDGVAGEQIVVAPPEVEELPKFGDFVYVEELPEAVTRVQPAYPEVAREANLEGTVLVQALVGKDGRVRDIRVVQSIPMLDEAAVAAVKKWVFKPALSQNRPVAVWVAIPVRFQLQTTR